MDLKFESGFDFWSVLADLIIEMEKDTKDVSIETIEKYIDILTNAENDAENILERIVNAKDALDEIVSKQESSEPMNQEELEEEFDSSIDPLRI